MEKDADAHKHQWDYTGSDAVCENCGLTEAGNTCLHQSVTPPTFGAWRCNDCNMTFACQPCSDHGE